MDEGGEFGGAEESEFEGFDDNDQNEHEDEKD